MIGIVLITSSVTMADPRLANRKRPAAPGSPTSDSAARKAPRLDPAFDGKPDGAATPTSETTSDDVLSNLSRASPRPRSDRPSPLSHQGSLQPLRQASPTTQPLALPTTTEAKKVDVTAFAMTIAMEQLLGKSSELGAARAKLDTAQLNLTQATELQESMADKVSGFLVF